MILKINGREVTQKEWDEHAAKRRETFLVPEKEWLQHPPEVQTSDTFMRGKRNGEQFAGRPELGEAYAAELRRKGGNPTGKWYCNQLARYWGDAEAWIDNEEDVKKRVAERGWICEGRVNVSAAEGTLEQKDVSIDEDIVREDVEYMLEQNPEMAPTPKEKEELFQQTKERMKPYWAED